MNKTRVKTYDSAPGRGAERDPPLRMGAGMTLCVGAVASESLNRIIETSAARRGIPLQRDMRGRDTGTDGMAGVLGNVDCAATSVGFPIRNMHTISELGHCGDVHACLEALYATLETMADENVTGEHFLSAHPRLERAEPMVGTG